MGKRLVRWTLTLIAAVSLCGTFAAGASAYEWTTGPAAELASGGLTPTPNLISCADLLDCTGLGSEQVNGTNLYGEPIVFEKVDGQWQTPAVLAGFASFLAQSDSVEFSGLDCPAAGECIAAGTIVTSADAPPISFSISEQDGSWGDIQYLGEGLADGRISAPSGEGGEVSCASVDDCVVVGGYSSGLSEHAVEAFGSVSGGFGAVSEDLPDETFTSVSCPPDGSTCTATGYSSGSGSVEAIVQSETGDGAEFSTVEPITDGSGPGLHGWEGYSISCPTEGGCTVVGQAPSNYYTDPAYPFAVQELSATGDWDEPVLLGTGADYDGFQMGALSCPADGSCVIGGDDGSGDEAVATYAQDTDGSWGPGFLESPVPTDANTGIYSISDSVAVGCAPGFFAIAACTFLGGYSKETEGGGNGTTTPYTFEDDFSGTDLAVFSVSPAVGPSGGGQQITITGTGFGNPGDTDVVTFVNSADYVEATNVTVISNTQILATTPPVSSSEFDSNGTLTSDVVVTTEDNGSTEINPPSDRYTFSPWVDSVSPVEGQAEGGDTITIKGSGFGPGGSADTVAFVPVGGGDPIQATDVTVQDDNTITATVPDASMVLSANDLLETDVVVTTALGASTPTQVNDVYIFDKLWVDKVSPASGRLSGGEQVTITGEGFGAPGSDDLVTFTAQDDITGEPLTATDVKVVSDTEITATTPDIGAGFQNPSNAVVTDVQVTDEESVTSPVSEDDVYTFSPVTVDSLSADDGPVAGGNVIVVGGTGFGNPGDEDTVQFVPQGGGAALSSPQVTVINDSTLVATVPDASAEIDSAGDDLDTDVQVSTPHNGSSAINSPDDAYKFTVLSVTGLSVNNAPAGGGTPVVITGTGFGDPGAADSVQFVANGVAPLALQDVRVLSGTTIDAVTPDATSLMPASGDLYGDLQVTNAKGTTSDLGGDDAFRFTQSDQLLISEVRLTGPPYDENDVYIELTNPSSSAVDLTGWTLDYATQTAGFSPSGTGSLMLGTGGAPSSIPAGGHYLIAQEPDYSLATTPDQALGLTDSSNSGDNGGLSGVQLIEPDGTTVADSVGYLGSPDAEGFGLTYPEYPVSALEPGGASEIAFVRRYVDGVPLNTGDNANDFALVAPDANTNSYGQGAQFVGQPAVLGVPSPLDTASPAQVNNIAQSYLLDTSTGETESTAPNFEYDPPSDGQPVSESDPGTLIIRRTITNVSQDSTITDLQIRITGMSTYGDQSDPVYGNPSSPGSVAILDDVSAPAATVDTSSGQAQIAATTLQSSAGGVNSVLTVDLPLQTGSNTDVGLIPGQSVNVAIAFSVYHTGSFAVAYNVEDDLKPYRPATGTNSVPTNPATSAGPVSTSGPTGVIRSNGTATVTAATDPVTAATINQGADKKHGKTKKKTRHHKLRKTRHKRKKHGKLERKREGKAHPKLGHRQPEGA